MKQVKLFPKTGSFAENKDIARDIRLKEIMPTLEKSQEIIIDFEKVDGATQSFIHALISDAIRQYPDSALDRIIFKSCNETIQKIINIVIEYMQESI